MALDFREQQALKHCIKWRLLDPIPDMIKWTGKYVRVWIPPYQLKEQEDYDAWKQQNQKLLPQWVMNLKESYIFYDKMILLNQIICELDINQDLPLFVDRYLGSVGKDPTQATSHMPQRKEDHSETNGDSLVDAFEF